jgi:hypothetical protein
MARFVVLLLLGATVGGAVVWLLPGSGESRPARIAAPVPAAVVEPPDPASTPADAVAGGGFAAERLAVFEQVAAVDEPSELESRLRVVVGRPASLSRTMELEALLARYVELDPEGAATLARRLYLDTRFLVPVFETWAVTDAEAAIAAVALIQPAARQRKLALAILGTIGNDAGGFERVAAALPEADRRSFEVDALIEAARHDPFGTLQSVLAMEQSVLQSYALVEITGIAASHDPRGTLAVIDRLDDYTMRLTNTNRVLGVWAAADPEAVFAWLESADSRRLPDSPVAFRPLAQSDPERLLAMANTMPASARTNAQRAALQAIAEADAEAAIALLASMPPSANQDQLLQTIAQSYGRQNPELALAWADGLSPPSNNARASVIQGIAAVNIDRALDIVVADAQTANSGLAGLGITGRLPSSLSLMMSLTMLGNDDQIERVVDRLAGIDNPAMGSMISSAMSRWSRTDPNAALNWALNNADRIDASAFSNMANEMANTDIDLALATMARLPPAQRAGWFEGVASGVARYDVNQALSLLNRYQGEPGYAEAYGAVVNQLAQLNPAAAASMLSDAPAGSANSLMSASFWVAREWTMSDPAAAANWATTLSDPSTQSRSLSQVAQVWAEQDPDAARQWLLGLTSGVARDAALEGYISSAAQRGEFDPRLLDAYSTPQLAQQAAYQAITRIGRTDPAAARQLMNDYITDETMRQRAEEQLARSGGSSGTTIVSSDGIVIVQ